MQKYGFLEYDIEEVLERYKNNSSAYDEFRTILENHIKDLICTLVEKKELEENDFEIKSRVKSVESLRGKMERKGGKYKNPLKDITDLVGVKINLTSVIGANKVYEMLLHKLSAFQDEMDKRNSEDIEKIKRENRQFGYIGRHIVLTYHKDMHKGKEAVHSLENFKAEIQIKTKLQNVWADIEHKANYKVGEKLDIDKQRDFDRLAAVLEIADNMFRDLIKSAEELNKKTIEQIKGIFSETPTPAASINSSDAIKYFLRNDEIKNKIKMLESQSVKISNHEISFIPSELIDLIAHTNIKNFEDIKDMLENPALKEVFNAFTKDQEIVLNPLDILKIFLYAYATKEQKEQIKENGLIFKIISHKIDEIQKES